MPMHDRVDIGPGIVDQQMHSQLAGRVALAAALVPIQVHDDHIFRVHHPFAHAGRRGQDASVIEPDGEIAIGCGNMATLVELFPELDKVVPGLGFASHRKAYASYKILRILTANSYPARALKVGGTILKPCWSRNSISIFFRS